MAQPYTYQEIFLASCSHVMRSRCSGRCWICSNHRLLLPLSVLSQDTFVKDLCLYLPRPTPMYPPSYMEPGMGWVRPSVFKQLYFVQPVPDKTWPCVLCSWWWRVRWFVCRHGSTCSVLNCALLCLCPRRPTPYGNQTDYRIYELNKRLQNWTEVRTFCSAYTSNANCTMFNICPQQ